MWNELDSEEEREDRCLANEYWTARRATEIKEEEPSKAVERLIEIEQLISDQQLNILREQAKEPDAVSKMLRIALRALDAERQARLKAEEDTQLMNEAEKMSVLDRGAYFAVKYRSRLQDSERIIYDWHREITLRAAIRSAHRAALSEGARDKKPTG